MSYKYSESEKFRANMFFVSGLALCSPLGVNVVYFCQNWKLNSLNGFILSVPFFGLGFYLILKSHDIMVKKDEWNA